MGLALEEAHGQNLPLPVGEVAHRLLQGDALHPHLIVVLVVLHLVPHADGVPAVGVHRLVEGHRLQDGVQGHHYVLTLDVQDFGNLLNGGLPLVLGHVGLLGLENLVGRVPHGPGNPHGAVVPEVAAYLPHNHGDAVGGKLHVQVGVEVVDGLDQADTPHLKQVVGVLPPVGEPLNHRQHQPQVAGDELLPGGGVPRLGPEKERLGLAAFQHLQLGSVHPAYLYFVLHDGKNLPPGVILFPVFPGGGLSYRFDRT